MVCVKSEFMVIVKSHSHIVELGSLGGTNLIYCSTGPTDPVFARKKKNNNMDSPIGYLKFIVVEDF